MEKEFRGERNEENKGEGAKVTHMRIGDREREREREKERERERERKKEGYKRTWVTI